jgi:hypothetical protein
MGYKGNDRCLDKVGDDEPIFVLRAQDKLAPALVKLWVAMAKLNGLSPERQAEAIELAEKMEDWQVKVRNKFPD